MSKRPPATTTAATAPVPFWDTSDAAYEVLVPIEQWSPWDTATLAGERVPGLVRVRSWRRRKIVVIGGVGEQAEELKDAGMAASQVEMHVTMWRPEHLQQYAALAKRIEVKAGTRGEPVAVDVVHPGLAMLGIRSLYVTSVGVPAPSAPGGPFLAEIQLQEFMRKKAQKDKASNQPFAIDKSVAGRKTPSAIEQQMNGKGAPSGVPEFLKPNR